MYEFKIKDLHCNSCIKKIEEVVKEVDDQSTTIGSVEESFIRIDSKLSENKVRDSIKKAGFEIMIG